MKYVPNILTVIRMILIPFIIFAIIKDEFIVAIVLYTISSITDILDGYIARKYNVISDFGKLVDPLADKLTHVSIILTLAIKKIVPSWVIALLLFKELTMIIGASFLYGKDIVVSSKWYGKATTVLLFLSVVSSMLIKMYNWYQFDVYMYAVAISLGIYSVINYYIYFYKQGYLLGKKEMKVIVKPKQGEKRAHVLKRQEYKGEKSYTKSALSKKEENKVTKNQA